jgi:hypothetical protein
MYKPILSISCFFIAVLFASSCKKNSSPSGSQPPSQDFHISFSTPDSNYDYQTGLNYQYLRDGSMADNLASDGYHFEISPATEISPLPMNANIHTAGFVFNYYQVYQGSPPWTAIGDSLFKTGQRTICFTGINYASSLGGLACYSPASVVLFWTTPQGILQNSGSGFQPSTSFYQIDSVITFHHVENLTLKYYDKIIIGSFQCRIFDPTDTTKYTDLTNGHFRMPVWKNGFD